MPVMPIYWGTHNAQERLTVKESFKVQRARTKQT